MSKQNSSNMIGGHPDDVPLNKEEKRVIATLQRLARIWPKSLWLLAAEGGELCIMRKTKDGKRAMPDGIDAAYEVDNVDIESDGGEWD